MAESSIPGISEIAEINAQIATTPEALQIPTRHVSLGFQLLYGLTNIVVGFCNITFFTLILPAQIKAIDPVNYLNIFALIAGLGAVAAVITNPLAGAFSDRTTAKLGRRRPWMIVGTLFLAGSMVLLANANSILLLGVGTILLQISINMVLAALAAVIPDLVPLRQRATIAAFAGMAPLIGGVIGQTIVTQVTNTQTTYYILTGASVLILVVFMLAVREIRLPKGVMPAFRVRDLLAAFWVSPIKYPDFGYTWLARCLVFLGYTTVVNFTLYFLQDSVHYTRLFPGQSIDQGVQIFFATSTGVLILSAIIGGILSDKTQRRKVFVVIASLVMTASLLLLAFFPVWPYVLIGSGVLGLGVGAYLAVDLALASQVLPTENDRGKDLGIMNTTIFIPQILAPIIAAIALNVFHTYTALFLILSVATFLAAILILPIKSVR